MNDELSTSGGGGCMTPLLVLAVCVFGIMVMMGGDDNTANDNTMPVLSGNEVMSRNQLNVLSDVTNNYLDCMGAGSCIVTDNGQVITTTNTTNAPLEVTGDRNNITTADGGQLCFDAAQNIWLPCTGVTP